MTRPFNVFIYVAIQEISTIRFLLRCCWLKETKILSLSSRVDVLVEHLVQLITFKWAIHVTHTHSLDVKFNKTQYNGRQFMCCVGLYLLYHVLPPEARVSQEMFSINQFLCSFSKNMNGNRNIAEHFFTFEGCGKVL